MLPPALRPALFPILETIEGLTTTIKEYDRDIEKLCKEKYPETELLRSIPGVGPITALTFVLTLEAPERFASSRDVPAYVGLLPRRSQSGDSDPQLRITKCGSPQLRRLLVSCAQYILGTHGPDSELRQWGERLMARGGAAAKKRAVVAVARKLTVILHRLWITGMLYEPFPNAPREDALDSPTEAGPVETADHIPALVGT
ncbi:MAG: transposase [Candidatus Hydrogenedentes bacterium]|nr:transposase [Candidatus Hydrogenedentota bacterium]